MIYSKIIFFPLCFLLIFFNMGDSVEPLIVQLEGENELQPVFLVPWEEKESSLSPSYLQQLFSLLVYDFSHGGYAQVLTNSPERMKYGQEHRFEGIGAAKVWQKLQAHFVLFGKVKDKELMLRVLNTENEAVKEMQSVLLVGNIEQDRQCIHILYDRLSKELFGKEGIASTHILYTIKQSDSVSEVWEMDYDGANLRPIIQNQGYCVTPIYVPPVEKKSPGAIAYVSYLNGQPKIYTAHRRTGQSQRMTLLRGNQLMPSFSKQRDFMVFISDVTGNPDLFIQPFHPEKGLQGKPRQIFRARHATQGSPVFSPDGQSVAFVSDKDGTARVYMLHLKDTTVPNPEARLISKRCRESSSPAWSPDGRYLAYCGLTQGVRQIWIYDFLSLSERQLTEGPGHKENPSWAPDSFHLVYNGGDNSHCELYRLDLAVCAPIKLTSGSGQKRFPCWEPR